MIQDNYLYCHNCGWSGEPTKFIQHVDGISYNEILEEAKDYDVIPQLIDDTRDNAFTSLPEHTLPKDSINIYDTNQIEYHMDNGDVMGVRQYAKRRGLFTAINKPKTLWVSVADYTHKSRLIIPFYDTSDDIVFYQSRTVFSSEKLPKYMSKIGGDKSLFNINNISEELDAIFIFEGPIDACFVQNGIGVAGIQENSESCFNDTQRQQIQQFPLHEKIWVLDSQHQDTASKTKTLKLAEQGQKVFVWPEKYGTRFKDFNDMALGLGINEIPYKFIQDNSYTGLKVKLLLNVP
jgi:hypothetical protein